MCGWINRVPCQTDVKCRVLAIEAAVLVGRSTVTFFLLIV